MLCAHGYGAGVRARQERVTFATVEDDSLLLSAVRPLLGRKVKLTVSADGVQLVESDGTAAGAAPVPSVASASKSTASSGKISKVWFCTSLPNPITL